MKRLILVAAALGFLFVSSGTAAEVATKTKRSDTNKVELSGELGLGAVFREDFFDKIFPRRGSLDGLPTRDWAIQRDEAFGVPSLSLALEARLKDELGAVIRISLVPGYYGYESPVFGAKNSFAYFEELYVYSKEFLGSYTNLYVGEKNVKIDLRENGDEFFCNILQSENPFTGAVHTDPAMTGMPQSVSGRYTLADDGLGTPPLMSSGGMSWNPYMGGNAWWNNYAGQSNHSTFVGAQLEWIASRTKTGLEPFKIDFAMGMILETQMVATDTLFFLARPLATFDIVGTKKHWSKIQGIGAVISGDKDTAIGAVGIGASIKPTAFLEVFGEYMVQFGEYTSATNAWGKDKIHQEAHAGYVGLRASPEISISLDKDKKAGIIPFAEASWWWVGGDRGDPRGKNRNRDFVSFEDVDTFLIMEGNEFGLDVDCNYTALKFEIGVRFETIELSLRYGSFYTIFEPAHDIYGAPPTGGANFSRQLGNEIDIRFSFKVKEQLRVNLTAAFLFDAYFWDETTRSRNIGTIGGTSLWEGSGTGASIGCAEIQLEF